MRNCVLITGPVGGGKTSVLRRMIRDGKGENRSVGGIVAAPLYRNGKKSGYDVMNVRTGELAPLVRSLDGYNISLFPGSRRIGRFLMLEAGLAYAMSAVEAAADADILCIDEIGPLEAGGGGHRSVLDRVLKEYNGTLWIVVRDETLQWLKEKCEGNRWTVSCVEPQKK